MNQILTIGVVKKIKLTGKVMESIQIKKEFNAPIDQVFELLAKHATYNLVFAPVQLRRIKDSSDPERPDGLGSIRRVGLGSIKLLQEEITRLDVNQRIEYKIVKSPLIKHHLGIIEFQKIAENRTLVTYTIELQTRLPFVGKMILAQLKQAIKLGLTKLAKSFV